VGAKVEGIGRKGEGLLVIKSRKRKKKEGRGINSPKIDSGAREGNPKKNFVGMKEPAGTPGGKSAQGEKNRSESLGPPAMLWVGLKIRKGKKSVFQVRP